MSETHAVLDKVETVVCPARSESLREALVAVLGAEHVQTDEREVEAVSRTNLPFRRVPAAAVYPSTAEEVQAVLAVARAHGQPVWVVSKGKNWGYGSKSASYAGGITMILERMNRIHEVNEELGYAVIEPGVTYGQLRAHLEATGSRLWTDSTGSTREGSVLGNALDKGRGVTPYADHFGALCGMEVVLPDGARVVTGGAGENNRVWAAYKWGLGPYMDGLFAQSNFGVVVKGGVWLMPAPEAFDFAVFEYTAGPERFGAFVDAFRELAFAGDLQARPHLANDFAMACIVSQYPYDLRGDAPCLSADAMQVWRKRLGVSEWTFGCGVYGSREEVRMRKRRLKRVLGRYGTLRFLRHWNTPGLFGRAFRAAAKLGLRLQGKSPQLLAGLSEAIELFRGVPTDYFSRQVYFMSHDAKPEGDVDPPRDGCGFVWTGPLVPFTGRDAERLLALVKPLYAKHGFDFFVELIVESPRALIMLFGIFFDRSDPRECERARALYEDVQAIARREGYPPYRSSIASSAATMDGDPAMKGLLAKIKGALDPDNVLAPGRYGIGTPPG